jgi:branched-chain amino acid transport system ATP-binding protein
MSLMRVENLTRRFRGITAVEDLSFSLADATVTGLIGPNGSGKSTTIDCLSGFQRPDGGRWFLHDEELTGLSPDRIARLGLTRTFQMARSYDDMSLIANLCQSMQPKDGIGWWAAFVNSHAAQQADAVALDRANALLNLIGLTDYANAPARILSYGQRKLLALAATLMKLPKLVVLDEPVAGVNPAMIERIGDFIKDINRRDGVTFLIVEHNVDFIMSLCDHVIVLDGGRKLIEGDSVAIRGDPRVLDAYLGYALPAVSEGYV